MPAPACSGHGSASRSGHRRGGESREPPHSSLQSRADRPAAGHVVIRPRTRDRSGRLRRPVAGQCACRSSAGLGGSALPGPVAAQRCSAERSRGGVSRAATQPPAGAGRGGTDLRCRYLVGGRSGQTGGTGVTSLNCRTGVSQWPSAMRRVTGPQQHRPCGSCVPCCAAAPTMARSLSGPRPYGRPGPRLRHGADSYCLTRPAGDGRARSSPAVCQRRTPSAATDRTRWDRSLPRPGRLQSHWRADDGAATQARSRRRAFGPPPTAARQRRRRSSAPNWRCAWRTGSPEPRTTAMPCIACLAATGPQMSTSPPLPGDACLWSRMRCCLAPLKLPPLSIYPTRSCRGRYTEVVETQALPPRCRLPRQLAAPRQLRRPRPCSVDDAPSPLGSFSRRAPGEVPAGLRCAPAFLFPAEGALPVQRPAGVSQCRVAS